MSRLVIKPKEEWELRLKLKKNETGFITRKFNIFKNIISVVGDLTSEMNFILDSKGLNFDTMDSKHISYIKTHFSSDFFENFNCSEKKVYGMSLKWLSVVFNNTKGTMDMSMKFTENKCIIEFDDNNNNKIYELNLLEIDYESLTIPLDYTKNIFKLNSRNVYEIFKEISSVEEQINIEYKNHNICFSSNGELGKLKINKKYISDNDPINVSFSITQLLIISKLYTLNNNIELVITNETPLRYKFELDKCQIEFYIAPKIEDD